MAFDPKIHEVKFLIIKCGQLLFPEENNITELYSRASRALGVPEIITTSVSANQMPAPHEMTTDQINMAARPGYVIPRKDCPECGKKETVVLVDLCRSCQDSENGKYKTMWACLQCGKYKDRSEKAMVTWLEEFGVDFGNQSKKSLGIQTMTDEGVK